MAASAVAAYVLVGLAVVPLVGLAGAGLVSEVGDLLDPCASYGAPSGSTVVVGSEACPAGGTSTSETKAQAVARLAAIQGGALVVAAFALVGATLGSRGLLAWSAGLAASYVFAGALSFWPLVLVVALVLGAAAGLVPRRPRDPGTRAAHRALAAACLVPVAGGVASLVARAPAAGFEWVVFLAPVLAFAAAAALALLGRQGVAQGGEGDAGAGI